MIPNRTEHIPGHAPSTIPAGHRTQPGADYSEAIGFEFRGDTGYPKWVYINRSRLPPCGPERHKWFLDYIESFTKDYERSQVSKSDGGVYVDSSLRGNWAYRHANDYSPRKPRKTALEKTMEAAAKREATKKRNAEKASKAKAKSSVTPPWSRGGTAADLDL